MKKLFIAVLSLAVIPVFSLAAMDLCHAGWFGPGQASWSDNFMGTNYGATGGHSGAGWNGGYWRGPNMVPTTYPKNNAGWGRVHVGGFKMGAGAGYGGGGFSIKFPGQSQINLGW
jgi:hypothetical protein